MNKIISRMLVFGLLFSFVQAQEPSRDIDKEEAKNVSAQQKGKSADKDKASRDANMPDGVTSDYEQKHETVAKTGPKSATTGKLGPGGSSARVSSADELPGTTYNATPKKAQRKGFFGRLFGRGKSASKEPAIGQSQVGQRPSQEKGDKGEPGPRVEGPLDDGDG